MKILYDLFIYFYTTIYLTLFGNENIEVVKNSDITLKLEIDGVQYECTSVETKFKLKFRKLIISSKTISLFEVTMKNLETGEVTTGTYPAFTPRCLKDTGYPHHVAIRSHYQTQRK